jgi:hypothetical protein
MFSLCSEVKIFKTYITQSYKNIKLPFLGSKNLGDGSVQMFLKIVDGGLIENHFLDYSNTVLADWPARFMEIGLGDSCRLSTLVQNLVIFGFID